MSPRVAIARALAAMLAAAGCYGGAGEHDAPSTARGAADAAASSPSSREGGAGANGLPCEVAAVLRDNHCLDCHGAAPSAPMSLVSYDDLVAPSKSDATRLVAEQVVARMIDGARPMPPSGLAPRAQASVVEQWLAAGHPRGGCDADAGSSESLPSSQCSSGSYWTRGDSKSATMNPGLPCVGCHAPENARRGRERAPELVGGTVYPSAHEPDLCNGTAVDATVVITDADGVVLSLPVNAAGNFFAWRAQASSLRFPITAKVSSGGKERAMSAPQMTGDCNGCHSTTGRNGAPGRIQLP